MAASSPSACSAAWQPHRPCKQLPPLGSHMTAKAGFQCSTSSVPPETAELLRRKYARDVAAHEEACRSPSASRPPDVKALPLLKNAVLLVGEVRPQSDSALNRPQGQTRICLKILGFRFLPLFVSKNGRSSSLGLQEPRSSSRVAALRCQSSSGSMERSTSTFPSGSAVNQACARGCGPGAEGSRQASAGAAEASGEGRRRSCSSRRRPRWRRL